MLWMMEVKLSKSVTVYEQTQAAPRSVNTVRGQPIFKSYHYSMEETGMHGLYQADTTKNQLLFTRQLDSGRDHGPCRGG